jgi:LuxR family transcriptional regulator, maltose regulon positive regulatory protein
VEPRVSLMRSPRDAGGTLSWSMEVKVGNAAVNSRSAPPVAMSRAGVRTRTDNDGGHRLRVLPFGPDRDLELDGRRLGIGRLKVIELASFLALNPHGIPRSEISRQLFPDSEPGHAGNHFRQVAHKLRIASGIPVIRRHPNLVALPDSVQLDSADAHLEVLNAGAQKSWAGMKELRDALGQIHGHYLEESRLVWAEQRRYRIDVIEEEARLTLAQMLAGQGQYQMARDQCELVLTRNRYSDSAYRLLVSIERSAGSEVSCMAVYRRAAEALQEIGLRPGDARRLFQTDSPAEAGAARSA